MDTLFLIVIGIAVVVWLLRLAWERIQLRLKEQNDSAAGTLPVITTIQASDAPQHTGKLQEILKNLKTGNRIKDFTVLSVDDTLSSLEEKIGEKDLILIVLTQQLEPQKERIENRLKALQTDHPGVRFAEIIVDNVVYENEFFIFPDDLRPIRERENMDAAWNNIEQSLEKLFPELVQENRPQKPINWPEKLKELAKGLGKALIVYVVLMLALIGFVIIAIILILNELGG